MTNAGRPGDRGLRLAALLLCAAYATTGPSSAQQTQRPTGYLTAETRPDGSVLIPPPPSEGSPAAVADVEAFKATRSLEGTSRWTLASGDNAVGYESMIGHYACALGADIDPDAIPAVRRVASRMSADVFPLIGAGKDLYQRPRPFRVDDGQTCIAITPEFGESGSYPSAHSSAGWSYALLLAQLAPDRAAQLLARGRAFAESRVVCGVHYPTDVESGRLAAEAVFAAIQSEAAFQDDLAAARAELAEQRAAAPAPDPTECAVEVEAARTRPW